MKKWKKLRLKNNIHTQERDVATNKDVGYDVDLAFYDNCLPQREVEQHIDSPVKGDAICSKKVENTQIMEPLKDTECEAKASKHLTPEQLMRYFDGSLDEVTEQQVKAHIDECAPCQGVLDCLAMPIISDEQLLADLMAAYQEEDSQVRQEEIDGQPPVGCSTDSKKADHAQVVFSPLVSASAATIPSTEMASTEMAVSDAWSVVQSDLESIVFQIKDFDAQVEIRVAWASEQIQKWHYPHFMLKEIHEQPDILRSFIMRCTNRGHNRVRLGDLGFCNKELRDVSHVFIQACGSSRHAGDFGQLLLENMAEIPVGVDFASEFRCHGADTLPSRTMMVAISHSGENSDTLAGVRIAKERGLKVISIVNDPDSTLARESDGVILTDAGAEIGVSATKSYTAQLGAVYLLGLHIASLRGRMDHQSMERRLACLLRTADYMARYLEDDSLIRYVADEMSMDDGAILTGRAFGCLSAKEGALKLKEIAAIHAEALPGGELKQAWNLLDKQKLPAIVVATSRATSKAAFSKIADDIHQLRARQARIVAIADQNDSEIHQHVQRVIPVPTGEHLMGSHAPFLAALPLQLLAYHLGVRRGCPVDQPLSIVRDIVRRCISVAATTGRLSNSPKATNLQAVAEGRIVVRHDSSSQRMHPIRVTLADETFNQRAEALEFLLHLNKGERVDVPLADAAEEGWTATVERLDSPRVNSSSERGETAIISGSFMRDLVSSNGEI